MQGRQVVRGAAQLVEQGQRHGGNQQHIGAPVPRDRPQGVGRIEAQLRHDGAGDEQCREQTFDITIHVVHRQREHDAPTILEGAAVGAAERGAQHHVVGQHDALGRAGGARGVDDVAVRQRPGVHDRLPGGGAGPEVGQCGHPGAHGCVCGGKHDDPAQARETRAATLLFPAWRELVQELLVVEVAELVHRDQQHRIGLPQDIAEFIAPVQEIDRHRHGTCAGDAEFHRHELRVVGHQQAHMVARLHAGRDQPRRNAFGPELDLAVGPAARVRDHIGAVRKLLCDRVQRLVERAWLPARVAPPQRLLAIGDRADARGLVRRWFGGRLRLMAGHAGCHG